jgi:hypothetical protein
MSARRSPWPLIAYVFTSPLWVIACCVMCLCFIVGAIAVLGQAGYDGGRRFALWTFRAGDAG